jgi:hypothetical protein
MPGTVKNRGEGPARIERALKELGAQAANRPCCQGDAMPIIRCIGKPAHIVVVGGVH